MSKFLCTFSGKYGDILWSLATAKYIAEKVVSQSVDFAVMPYYQNLLPLLAEQPYLDNVFIVPDWLRTHSNHGDQPWEPPHLKRMTPMVGDGWSEYERAWHLTYRAHPGISAPAMPLIDFIAYQQGIAFNGWNPVPFIEVSELAEELTTPVHFSTGQMPQVIAEKRLVTYSFNEQYADAKKMFFEELWSKAQGSGLEFFNVSEVSWKEAAWIIKKALTHVGCRSACWVIANGVGQSILTYEPHPARHASGNLGKVFGCPYGRELTLPFGMPARVAADATVNMLKTRMEEVNKVAV